MASDGQSDSNSQTCLKLLVVRQASCTMRPAMNFNDFCQYLSKIEATPSRLAMTEILVELLAAVEPGETQAVVNFSLGQLQPKYHRLEFNLAEKMVLRAIAQAFGVGLEQIQKEYKISGDLGSTAEQLQQLPASSYRQSSILEVYQQLVEIATDSGTGSQDRKIDALSDLLKQLEPLACRFVARMVVGKLRLGFSDMTILDALSWLETGDKSKRNQLEEAYQLKPDIAALAQAVKQKGVQAACSSVEVELGVPVVPALAQRLKTADEMIKKMGRVYVDPKYDGTRVQIHYRRNSKFQTQNPKQIPNSNNQIQNVAWEVKTFTRNLDETSHMFPELTNLGEYINADEVILDAEAIGYDRATGRLLPFQQTIQRKRKHGIAEMAESIPLKFFTFDILYKDGQSLIGLPLSKRYRILHETIKPAALIEPTEFILTEDPSEVRAKHADLLAQGLEGAMVKKFDGVYQPGRKGWNWVKFKEAEGSAAKLSDTVDALVMGLYVGKGKRAEFGVGAFLIGLRSEKQITNNKSQVTNKSQIQSFNDQNVTFEEGKFYTISKVGTGLTDDQWRELANKSQELQVKSKPNEYEVDKNLEPDIWLSPGLVVEIAADEITKSPIHTASLALRFPRLVKFREDKSAEEVTSISELEEIV